MKFLKYKTCLFNKLFILNSLLFFKSSFAVDFMPQGKLIRKSISVSQNPTVQMYFDANRPPVINITPSRPTVVQFPVEVRSCISASNLISVSYADKTSQSNDKNNSELWYSAVVLNVGNFIQGGKINEDDLLKIPPTVVTCQIRISDQNSNLKESYTWQTIGVSISDEKNTYFVVYLLNSLRSQNLPTETELTNLGLKSIENIPVEHNSKPKINFKNELEIKKYNQIFSKHKGIITKNNSNIKSDVDSQILDLFAWKDM